MLPLTVTVLVALYSLQSKGTAGIGKFFGPIVLVWFTALATMGIINIVHYPAVLAAFNPWYAFNFMIHNGWFAFIALGAVVLALTGAEALYADMGHFGKKPVRAGLVLGRVSGAGAELPGPGRAADVDAFRDRPIPSSSSWAHGASTRWWCCRPWPP